MNRQEQDPRMLAIEEMERELAEPLREFRGAVTALAERELARTRRAALPTEKTSGWRLAWVYAWAPAGLLVVLMAVGLAISNHEPMPQAIDNGTSVARVEQAPAARTRVSADALLTEIDEDLNQNVPTPLAPLEVSTTGQTHTTTTQSEEAYGVEP